MQESIDNHQGQVHGLFPTPLIKFPFLLNETEKTVLMNLEMITATGDQEIYNHLFSRDTYVLNLPQLKPLREKLENKIDEFACNVLGHSQPLIITQSWVNQNKPGEAAHRHTHPNSIISGVLYIEVPKDSGTIRFHKHMPNPTTSWTVYPETDTARVVNSVWAWDWIDILSAANELLLFPSYLPHSVNVNDSDSDRWSLAFNAIPKYKLTGQGLDELDWMKIAERLNEVN